MMRLSRSINVALYAFGAILLSAVVTAQNRPQVPAGFLLMNPDDIKFPEGANSITLYGDPAKPGIYITRNRFVPGRGSRPHFHNNDRYVTVIKGTWYVSLGPDADVYNPEKMVAVKPGGIVYHPAFGHHYDMAKDEEVIVQIIGMGPVSTTQLESPASVR